MARFELYERKMDDLEGQIEADLFNLNLATEDFGREAMEATEAKEPGTWSKQPSGEDAGGDAPAEDDEADNDNEEGMDEAEEEDEDLAKEMEEISKEVEEEGGLDPAVSQAMEEENAEFDSEIQMMDETEAPAKKSKKAPAAK